jgi:hypothetical protein
MTDEKNKNTDQNVEWSFDFSRIGESFNRMVESLAGDEEVKTSTFSAERQSETNARIRVDFSVGVASVEPLDEGSTLLFEATVKHVGELEFKDEAGDTREIRLRQKTNIPPNTGMIRQGFRAVANREDFTWNVRLSREVPLSLDIHGGVGPATLSLAQLKVRSCKVDTGVGELNLTLPAQQETIKVDLDGGVGQTRVFIPENADVTLDIDGGIGAVEVTIPPGAAVQLKANTGLGSVHVPASVQRLSRKEFMEHSGLWQSQGFDLAERRIIIKFDGGVGTFHLREAQTV